MAEEPQNSAEPPEAQDEARRAPPLGPGLHLLATPIGAAEDLSLRGLAALREADALACEDTRSLRKLMDIHGVPLRGRPLIAYHDHNGEAARPKVLARLATGESVVYASDAGTPLIADPGYKLAEAARAAGHRVSALPGPSAALTALLLSGLPTDAFSFIGFPPAKAAARRRFFERWAAVPGTLVLFEAPRRTAETLAEMAEILGRERPAALTRELTKRHEEVRRGTLESLAEGAAADPPRGEVALVVAPAPAAEAGEAEIDALLLDQLATQSVKDAVRTVVERLGAPRKMVYQRALALKGMDHKTDP